MENLDLDKITVEQINQEYQRIATLIGDHNYKIKKHRQILDDLYLKADHLNDLLHKKKKC